MTEHAQRTARVAAEYSAHTLPDYDLAFELSEAEEPVRHCPGCRCDRPKTPGITRRVVKYAGEKAKVIERAGPFRI